jgi:hypothetical protein
MRHAMAAASEAEIGALFHSGQEAAHIRTVLEEIGREQTAPTRPTIDNVTADGFANKPTKYQEIQGNGHAVLLDPRPSGPTTV